MKLLKSITLDAWMHSILFFMILAPIGVLLMIVNEHIMMFILGVVIYHGAIVIAYLPIKDCIDDYKHKHNKEDK